MKKILSFILVFGMLFGNISNLKAEEITDEELEKLLENQNQVCISVYNYNGIQDFRYSKTEIQKLPKDVILIMDNSGKMADYVENDYKRINQVIENFLPTLGEKDRVFLGSFDSNYESSYKYVHKKRFFTKENFSEIVDINPSFSSLNFLNLFDNVGNIEEEYEKDKNKNPIVSVLQTTDIWYHEETIDTSFSNWALKNAKTFMTVNVLSTATEDYLDHSTEEMKKAGHNNIFTKKVGDELTKEDFETINSQFKNETFFKPVLLKIVPENGAKLLSAFLVHKDSGSRQELTIVDGIINQEIVPEKEGDFTVEYTFETKEENLKMEIYYKNKQNKNVLVNYCKDGQDIGSSAVGGQPPVSEKPEEKIYGSIPNPEDFIIKNDDRVKISDYFKISEEIKTEENIELNSTSEEEKIFEKTENKNSSNEEKIELNSAPEKTENKKEEIKYLEEFYFDKEIPEKIEEEKTEKISENFENKEISKNETKMNNIKITKLPKTGALEIFLIIISLTLTFGIFNFRRKNVLEN